MAKQQPIYRAQRVAQLDASTLDDDLRSILWDQLSRGIESLPIRVSSFIGRYDAELQAALAAAMWAVSLRRSGLCERRAKTCIIFLSYRRNTRAAKYGHALRILSANAAHLY